MNYDGKDFKFSAWYTDSPNWVATSYCEAIPGEQNGDIINDAIYMRARDTEEALGVTVVGVPWKSSNDIIKPTLAGDHFTDVVLGGGGTSKNLLNQSLLIDLRTIDTLDLSKSWWDQGSVEGFSISGKLYFAASDYILPDPNAFLFNKQLAEDYSIASPYEAVTDGSWTLDKLTALSRTVSSDLLASLDGGRTFQHILSLHDYPWRCWTVFLSDIKKNTL